MAHVATQLGHLISQVLALLGRHGLVGGDLLLAEGPDVGCQVGVIFGQSLALLGCHRLVGSACLPHERHSVTACRTRVAAQCIHLLVQLLPLRGRHRPAVRVQLGQFLRCIGADTTNRRAPVVVSLQQVLGQLAHFVTQCHSHLLDFGHTNYRLLCRPAKEQGSAPWLRRG